MENFTAGDIVNLVLVGISVLFFLGVVVEHYLNMVRQRKKLTEEMYKLSAVSTVMFTESEPKDDSAQFENYKIGSWR